eukprot:8333759-Pyramimonas_sp.AAC.1
MQTSPASPPSTTHNIVHDDMVLHAPHPPAHSAPPPVVDLIAAEDNEAVITIVHKGRTPALRHLHRTH